MDGRRSHRALAVPVLVALLLTGTLALAGRAAAQTGPTSIDGFVYADVTADDLLGPGDQPLSGVMVTVRDTGGNPITSTFTAPDGHFQFFNLARSTYLVTETDPPGLGSVDAV